MSEGAVETEAGTAQVEGGSAALETDAEDTEAASLLGGMLENDPEALAAELAKWKGEARKWEGRSKQNSKAAQELEKIKLANMTELEKAQALATQAAEERDNALAMHSRVMAAATHNLPVELIDHLGSGTEEEIMERAESIASAIQQRAEALAAEMIAAGNAGRNVTATGARPVESMRAGAAPSSGETPTTPDQWFRQLLDQR